MTSGYDRVSVRVRSLHSAKLDRVRSRVCPHRVPAQSANTHRVRICKKCNPVTGIEKVSLGFSCPRLSTTKRVLDASCPKSVCPPPRCIHRLLATVSLRSSKVTAGNVLCDKGRSTYRPICFSEVALAMLSLSLSWLLHSPCKSATGARHV